MPLKGETCRCAVPVVDGSDPLHQATIALQRMCGSHGLTATDIHLVSSAGPWSEPIGDIAPVDGFKMYIYEATAA